MDSASGSSPGWLFCIRNFRTTQSKSSRSDQVRINNKLLQGLTEGLAGVVAGLGRTNQAWAGLAADTRLARAELREMTEALESRKRLADVKVVFSSATKLQDSRDSSNEGTNNTKIMFCPKFSLLVPMSTDFIPILFIHRAPIAEPIFDNHSSYVNTDLAVIRFCIWNSVLVNRQVLYRYQNMPTLWVRNELVRNELVRIRKT